MKFAKRIKELRENKQLTQKELANHIGISQSVLCDYENEKSEPTANVICKLAIEFHVSADYLLGLENEDGTKTYNLNFRDNNGHINFY